MKSVLALVALLAICPLVWAQQSPTVAALPNTVYVGADGKFEAPPDTAVVQFNIAPQEETAKAAYDHASRATEQVRQILRNNGIDPKSAEIGYYSLTPVYDWRTPKRKLIGYRVSSAVTLKLKDFSKVAAVIQQTAEVDAAENQSLSYILENIDAAKVKAVEDACQRARSLAEAVARSGGRTLGDLSYSSVDIVEPPRIMPMPRMMMRAGVAGADAAAPAPTEEFTPQKITVSAHVNAMFSLK